jgi:hypothetical protein
MNADVPKVRHKRLEPIDFLSECLVIKIAVGFEAKHVISFLASRIV